MASLQTTTSSPGLFDQPRHVSRGRRRVAQTSVDAFRNKTNSETDRREVLRLVKEKPRTCDEVCEVMGGRAPNTLSGRFTELADAGLIERTTERRPTRAGATANVWQATAEGRAS